MAIEGRQHSPCSAGAQALRSPADVSRGCACAEASSRSAARSLLWLARRRSRRHGWTSRGSRGSTSPRWSRSMTPGWKRGVPTTRPPGPGRTRRTPARAWKWRAANGASPRRRRRISSRRFPSAARTRSICTTAGRRPTPTPAPWRGPPPWPSLPLPRNPRRTDCSVAAALEAAAFAGVDPAEVVPQDLAVIEREGPPGNFGFAEPACLGGVVVGLRLRSRLHPAGIDGGDGVLARIAPGIGIGEELHDQLDVETGLLLCLAPASAPDLLAPIDEPARERPAPRLVLTQDQHDAPVRTGDDRVRGGQRVLLLRRAHRVTSPQGDGCGGGALGSRRPWREWVNRARQKELVASVPSARETASAVRAASRRRSLASTCAISTRRLA